MTGFLRITQFSGRDPMGQFWPFVGVAYAGYFVISQVVMVSLMGQMMSGMSKMIVDPAFQAAAQSQDVMQIRAQLRSVVPGMITGFLAIFAAHLVFAAFIAAAVARRLRDGGVSPWWGLLPLPSTVIGVILVLFSFTDTLVGPGAKPWPPSPAVIAFGAAFMLNGLASIVTLVTLIVMLCRRTQAP